MIMEYQKKTAKVSEKDNNEETFKEIPTERYISSREKQKISDNLIPNIKV